MVEVLINPLDHLLSHLLIRGKKVAISVVVTMRLISPLGVEHSTAQVTLHQLFRQGVPLPLVVFGCQVFLQVVLHLVFATTQMTVVHAKGFPGVVDHDLHAWRGGADRVDHAGGSLMR